MSAAGGLRCTSCARTLELWTRAWRCPCGGPLAWYPADVFDPAALAPVSGPWRYAARLPPVGERDQVTLGQAATPLLRSGDGVVYKLEHLTATGSFKDRGASVVAACLRAMGVERAVLDSSGNAGAAMAAHLAAAGVAATVFVPAGTSPVKLAQIASYGADLRPVEGDRAEVARRAEQAAEDGTGHYASHLWSPFFVAGMRTLAFELWEQLGDALPERLVTPVGTGSVLLGAYEGFAELRRAGLVTRVPQLIGVQATGCAPLVRALERGDAEPGEDARCGSSIAEGILIARPPRGRDVLAAVRATGGALLAVEEAEIRDAWTALARRGLLVEPTSAVAAAALRCLPPADGLTAVILTGTGLKALAER